MLPEVNFQQKHSSPTNICVSSRQLNLSQLKMPVRLPSITLLVGIQVTGFAAITPTEVAMWLYTASLDLSEA